MAPRGWASPLAEMLAEVKVLRVFYLHEGRVGCQGQRGPASPSAQNLACICLLIHSRGAVGGGLGSGLPGPDANPTDQQGQQCTTGAPPAACCSPVSVCSYTPSLPHSGAGVSEGASCCKLGSTHSRARCALAADQLCESVCWLLTTSTSFRLMTSLEKAVMTATMKKRSRIARRRGQRGDTHP